MRLYITDTHYLTDVQLGHKMKFYIMSFFVLIVFVIILIVPWVEVTYWVEVTCYCKTSKLVSILHHYITYCSKQVFWICYISKSLLHRRSKSSLVIIHSPCQSPTTSSYSCLGTFILSVTQVACHIYLRFYSSWSCLWK